MKEIIIVLLILFVHWLGDFVLQSDYDAKNKSRFFHALISHALIYSICTTVCWTILFPSHTAFPYYYSKGYINPFYLFCITFVAHTIQDYFTSRLNAKLWSENKIHSFWVSLSFDQWLHSVQLLLTYYFLTK